MRFAGSPQITNFLHSKMDFGDTAQAGQKSNAEQRITAMQADATVGAAHNKAEAVIAGAQAQADATRAQGDAAGQSSMWGGITSGIGSLATGFMGMNKPTITSNQAYSGGFNMGTGLANMLP